MKIKPLPKDEHDVRCCNDVCPHHKSVFDWNECAITGVTLGDFEWEIPCTPWAREVMRICGKYFLDNTEPVHLGQLALKHLLIDEEVDIEDQT